MKTVRPWALFVGLLLLLTACTSAQAAPTTIMQSWGAQLSCTTNTSGSCVLTHNLGVVPAGITASLVNRSGLVRVQSKTNKTVTILAAKSVAANGTVTPWASTAITVELVAAYKPSVVTSSPTVSPSVTSTPTTTPPTTVPTTTTPAPEPTERSCPSYPAFPDAACTGVPAGVVLKTCSTTVSTDNAKLDSCLFEGGLLIRGKNVTVTRSKINGLVAADYVLNWNLSGLTLKDVEIDGTGAVTANGEAAIGYDNYTCIRCNIHHSGRGFNFQNNVTIQDSWAHDFFYVSGAHQSAAGSNGGSNNRIIHNRLDCGAQGCSGALVMYGDFHPVDKVEIRENLFDGGSYCLYAGSTGTTSGKPYPHGTNITIENNSFGKKYASQNGRTCGWYGPVAAWETDPTNVWRNNVWADGSGQVNP